MKKSMLLSAALLIGLFGFSQDKKASIEKAKSLIAEHKYNSAFNELAKSDPENQDVETVLLKEEIVLEYFVMSISHQMFSLMDIGKDENIMDFRGQESTSDMIMFSPEEALMNLEKSGVKDCRIYKGLAYLYFEVHLKYGEYPGEQDIFSLMAQNAQSAIDGKCADFLTHYIRGYDYVIHEDYENAKKHFISSIEMNNMYPSAQYNLAYIFMIQGDNDNTIKYGKEAYEKYDDNTYKSDAARMVAGVYLDTKNTKLAIEYLEKADMIDPGNVYNLGMLVEAYLDASNTLYKAKTQELFFVEPDDTEMYFQLNDLYSLHNKQKELISFYEDRLKEYKEDHGVAGLLHYFMASLQKETDKKAAKKNLIASKEHFTIILEPGSEVFQAIDEALEEVK